MSEQPEALRLANALTKYLGGNTATQAAAELRRLHAVNQELLDVLKEIEPILARMYGPQAANLPPMQLVRAAIARAEGEV
jgi:hypothetical protein